MSKAMWSVMGARKVFWGQKGLFHQRSDILRFSRISGGISHENATLAIERPTNVEFKSLKTSSARFYSPHYQL